MDFNAFKPGIKTLADKHGLDLVVLFGSYSRNSSHEKSDIDVAVLSHRKIGVARLMSEFSEIFRKDDVQIIDLGHASPAVMRTVVEEGILLYERAADAFLKWKLYAIKIWMDTSWLRAMRHKKIVSWAEKNA